MDLAEAATRVCREAIFTGRWLPSLIAIPLLATPAEARVGQSLQAAAAEAKRADIPSATFAVRNGRVELEIWRSYPGDDHRQGPQWTRPQAEQKRRQLAGSGVLQQYGVESVSWASFPVPAFRYLDGTRIIYVAKMDAKRVWMIVAGSPWAWDTPYKAVEALCDGWVLSRGKLQRAKTW